MQGSSGRRIALLVGAVVIAAILLPVGARAISSRYHDDSLWANSLRSVAGLQVPYDFAIFLQAGQAVRDGASPYVGADAVIAEDQPAPYAYPPLLAIVVAPLSFLPEKVAGSSTPGMLFTLVLIACVIGTMVALGVSDWRCYPIALLYPPVLENLEYGAIGPILALLVALGWRYRDRPSGAAATAVGIAVVLKVFLWPLVVWLAATRRWRAAVLAVVTGVGLAVVSWAVIGFRGLLDYPSLLRRLSDLEAENSYSAFATLRALDVPELAARSFVVAVAAALLVLAWRAARASDDAAEADRRSLTLALAAGLVLTPILWLHYLVLLIVPIALARPKLSALWFAPLALTLFEALDWYRGWPRGDGPALTSVALVVVVVFVGALRSGGPDTRRAAPALSRGH